MTFPADFVPAACPKSLWLVAVLFSLLGAVVSPSHAQTNEPDPLAEEIEKLQAYLRDSDSTNELWLQVKAGGEPILTRAAEALAEGSRHLAVYRFAVASNYLEAGRYLNEADSMAHHEVAAFEAQSKRTADQLSAHYSLEPQPSVIQPAAPQDDTYAQISPASTRALAESSVPQIRTYFQTGFEYGRATVPEYGLYYVGNAVSAANWVEICKRISTDSDKPSPVVPSLHRELDALEATLLAAYRPPVSIDHHSDFILANSTIKEARELDAVGLRYGALLQYLHASQTTGAILRGSETFSHEKMMEDLQAARARLAGSRTDPSIGTVFAEIVAASAEDTAATAQMMATTVLTDVFPRYFAVMEGKTSSGNVHYVLDKPADKAREQATPVTVTLVRWPYT